MKLSELRNKIDSVIAKYGDVEVVVCVGAFDGPYEFDLDVETGKKDDPESAGLIEYLDAARFDELPCAIINVSII